MRCRGNPTTAHAGNWTLVVLPCSLVTTLTELLWLSFVIFIRVSVFIPNYFLTNPRISCTNVRKHTVPHVSNYLPPTVLTHLTLWHKKLKVQHRQCHWTRSWASSIHLRSSYLRCIFMLASHLLFGLPSELFPRGFLRNSYYDSNRVVRGVQYLRNAIEIVC
jgi:hypothetical protein